MRCLLLLALAAAPVAAQDTLRVSPNPYDDRFDKSLLLHNPSSVPVAIDSALLSPNAPGWGFWGQRVIDEWRFVINLQCTLPGTSGRYTRCVERTGPRLLGLPLAPGDTLRLWPVAFCAFCKTDGLGRDDADTLLLFTGGRRTPQRVVLRNPVLVSRDAASTPGLPDVHVFPNPARTRVVVTRTAAADEAEVRLADALGREVRRAALTAGAGRAEVDVSGLAPGVYVVSVGRAETWTRRRLVVR